MFQSTENGKPVGFAGRGARFNGCSCLNGLVGSDGMTLGEPLGPEPVTHLVAVAILATTVLMGLIAYRRETEGRDSGSGPALLLDTATPTGAPLPEGVEVLNAYRL